MPPIDRSPYQALAPLYDRIMAHVDYDGWADYMISICSRFAPGARRVLELGCGTGNLTFRLSRALRAEDFVATDMSEPMLAMARRKSTPTDTHLRFAKLDFRDVSVEGTFDLVVLMYDGINYLLECAEVEALLQSVEACLNPGGIFAFDQSTPANSINNLAYFDDRWDSPDGSYTRTSQYDREKRLHVTQFHVRMGNEAATEVHRQRAYDLQEMEMMLKRSSLRVEGCYDAFKFEPADGQSERVQWVLAKPRRAG